MIRNIESYELVCRNKDCHLAAFVIFTINLHYTYFLALIIIKF